MFPVAARRGSCPGKTVGTGEMAQDVLETVVELKVANPRFIYW